MTRSETAELLGMIVVAYEKITIIEAKLNLWTELLQDVDYEKAVGALKNYVKDNRFPPTIADIRERTGANALQGLPKL